MGLSPLRLALALVIGGTATGALYLTQQAVGRPLPAPTAAAQPPAAVPSKTPQRPVAAQPKSALPMPVPPRRIVFRHSAPGDVVLTVHGDELQVEFVSTPPKAPPSKSPAKAPVKVSAQLPHLATPVATR